MGKKQKHSPLPWRVEESISGNKNIIVSADEREVGSIFGVGSTECAEKWEANATLIVAAVNDREKLRGLVRRMGDEIEKSVWAAKQLPDSPSCHRIVHVGTQLLAEARALLKEADDGRE